MAQWILRHNQIRVISLNIPVFIFFKNFTDQLLITCPILIFQPVITRYSSILSNLETLSENTIIIMKGRHMEKARQRFPKTLKIVHVVMAALRGAQHHACLAGVVINGPVGLVTYQRKNRDITETLLKPNDQKINDNLCIWCSYCIYRSPCNGSFQFFQRQRQYWGFCKQYRFRRDSS